MPALTDLACSGSGLRETVNSRSPEPFDGACDLRRAVQTAVLQRSSLIISIFLPLCASNAEMMG
jgi:hypothetical protein